MDVTRKPLWVPLSQQKHLHDTALDLALPYFYTRQIMYSPKRFKAVQNDILAHKLAISQAEAPAEANYGQIFFTTLSLVLIAGLCLMSLSGTLPFLAGCPLCP